MKTKHTPSAYLQIGILTGHALAILRARAGLTQKDLANRLGIHTSNIHYYETTADVSVARVYSIATALEIPPATVFSLLDDLTMMSDEQRLETLSVIRKQGPVQGSTRSHASRMKQRATLAAAKHGTTDRVILDYLAKGYSMAAVGRLVHLSRQRVYQIKCAHEKTGLTHQSLP